MKDIEKINIFFDERARTIVGVLLKRIEVLEKEKALTSSLYKPLIKENERLRRENMRLEKRLRQAETIIDVQKKLCDMLGLTVPPIEQNESDE